MRKRITLISISIFVILIFIYSQSFTNAQQPPAGRTGCNIGTAETTCGASTCHNNTPNSGTGSVSITYSDSNLEYVPGDTYDMTVTTSESGKVKFGFEITVVDANGDSVGKFIIPNGVNNVSAPAGGAINHRRYLGHKNASATNSWSFQWQAPVTDRGQLTFFAAGNCANGNGQSNGDHIYTTSLSITKKTSTGVAALATPNNSLKIQSITSGKLNVQYSLSKDELARLGVYDINGRLIQQLCNESEQAGNYSRTFSLANDLNSGLYLLLFNSSDQQSVQKFFYQP